LLGVLDLDLAPGLHVIVFRMLKNYGLIAAFLLLMSACGGASASGEGGSTAAPGDNSAQYEGAIASDDVATGAARFDAVCMACHDGDAPPLENIGWTAARMRQQIREGSDNMPPVSTNRLNSADLEAVLAHLVTIGAVTE
jgi:mono/diheme cytochrome c family protein